jgi:hypothetical protein
MIKCLYLSVIIRHTLIPNLSRSKIFVLRSFRSLSINGIWTFQNPTDDDPDYDLHEHIERRLIVKNISEKHHLVCDFSDISEINVIYAPS